MVVKKDNAKESEYFKLIIKKNLIEFILRFWQRFTLVVNLPNVTSLYLGFGLAVKNGELLIMWFVIVTPIRLKEIIFRIEIKTIMSYGVECWSINKLHIHKMNVIEMWILS